MWILLLAVRSSDPSVPLISLVASLTIQCAYRRERSDHGANFLLRMAEIHVRDLMKRVAKENVSYRYFAGTCVGEGELEARKYASAVENKGQSGTIFSSEFGFLEYLDECGY